MRSAAAWFQPTTRCTAGAQKPRRFPYSDFAITATAESRFVESADHQGEELEGLEMERPGERPRTASDWVTAARVER